jgi:hypothetical protein
MEIYKKIYIRSEDDLPKEKCSIIYQNYTGLHLINFECTPADITYFLKYVSWYLQPVELPTEKEILPINVTIYRKARNLNYSDFCEWFNKYRDEYTNQIKNK